MKFVKKDLEKEIRITREEFLSKFMEAIANPFDETDVELTTDEKSKMQMTLMMNGLVIMKIVEKKLFGVDE